jgi:hypothetical protein
MRSVRYGYNDQWRANGQLTYLMPGPFAKKWAWYDGGSERLNGTLV